MALRSRPGEGIEGPLVRQRTWSKKKDGQRLSKSVHCKEESIPFLGKRPNQEKLSSRSQDFRNVLLKPWKKIMEY